MCTIAEWVIWPNQQFGIFATGLASLTSNIHDCLIDYAAIPAIPMIAAWAEWPNQQCTLSWLSWLNHEFKLQQLCDERPLIKI